MSARFKGITTLMHVPIKYQSDSAPYVMYNSCYFCIQNPPQKRRHTPEDL